METRKQKSVLIVEDSSDLQLLLAKLLEKEGYTVFRSDNGQEALTLLRGLPELPRFILLDLMMPVMNGLEFRQAQQKDPRLNSIPIVVMTAYSDPQAMTKTMDITNILKKPISIDDLLHLAEILVR